METFKEFVGMEPIYHESDDSYTPSKTVTSMFTARKVWYHPMEYSKSAKGTGKKVLVVGVDQVYLTCANGKRYRAGNHPVEVFVVVKHLADAGFEIEYATLSGESIKLEEFAIPNDDKAIMDYMNAEKPKWTKPKVLSEVVASLKDDSPYEAIFFPGGQGAILGLPESKNTKDALNWFIKNDKYVIAICHGPSSFLSLSIDENPDKFPFKGYKFACFSHLGDQGATMAGYLPGPMPYFFDEKLEKLGMEVVSPLPYGITHVDRKLLTADNPFVADKLGNISAEALLETV